MSEKSPTQAFQEEVRKNVQALGQNQRLKSLTLEWIGAADKYTYNYSWLGRPVIQYPQDLMAVQELIFRLQPDLIIETGIAHGGSLLFSASMLELNAICGGPQDSEVLGIDIDIRPHNREALEKHPLSRKVAMLQGSSIDPKLVAEVAKKVRGKKSVLVFLDSNHTHAHVLQELQMYSDFVTPGSYLVVFDTLIEDLQADSFPDRPWGKGNNPKTAVWEFLKEHQEFEVDHEIENKLMITVAPDGYLRRKLR